MQLTLRIAPELADDLKRAAGRRGESVNAFATAVLAAAVDPDLAGDEVDRLRERLARAGLLSEVERPDGFEPADPVALASARRAAGKGTPLSDLVRDGRS